MMKLYTLALNGKPILEIEIATPLPVRPVLHTEWLRHIVRTALDEYFKQPPERQRHLLTAASRS